jgi:ABC-type glycerol-3-phosphate transport system substrate-binding protein
LTTQLVEWLAGRRGTSLLNSETNEPNVLSLAAAEALNHAASWFDNGLIDRDDLYKYYSEQDPAEFSPVTPQSLESLTKWNPALARFSDGKALFLRDWTHSISALQNYADSSLAWDVSGMIGLDSGVSVGALGGWSVGVYRYSQNPASAARVAAWLTSAAFQRGLVTSAKVPAIPSRPELYQGELRKFF